MIGQSIGPYQVLAELGKGGMGEVYRARDTNLGRDVALKILPDSFAVDADRVARFRREAQVLASLNHPNIAAIYGIEGHALVMELIEGEDLSTLIDHGHPGAESGSKVGMPLDDALKIARQILDALETAHEQGIVHRDLKPQNIKVRDDGTVKVLDFGLAKALTQDQGPGTQDTQDSPTLTARATQMGVILGTASYMSPEQARGRAVDKRTDVWAFGCVLYEMLTGRKAFDGEDATEIISSVVRSDPNLKALPAAVPSHVRTIVERCLTKDRKARIPDVAVVRYMLDGTIPASESAAVTSAPQRSRAFSRIWPAAAALLALTTIGAGLAWYHASSVEPAKARFIVLPPDGTVFSSGVFSGSTVPAISPDGSMVAFTAQDNAGKRLLYVRSIDTLAARVYPGSDGAVYPFWSPDSRFVGFGISGKLMKVAASGGPVQLICNLFPGISSRGSSWNREDVIIFNNGPAQLYRAPAAGGTAVAMGVLGPGQSGQQFPSFLPDGRHFVFHATGSADASGLYLGSLDSNETRRLMPSDTGAVYDAGSGRLLFVRQGTLVAQPFDLKTHALTGDAAPIAEHVESVGVPGLVAFSVSDRGTLAYGVGLAAGTAFRLVWVDRHGKQLGMVGPEADYRGIALSPDELQIAAHRHNGDGGDIWLIDVKQNSLSRFTLNEAQENSSPVWSPKGDRIAFQSIRDGKPGVYVAPSNNSGTTELVVEGSVAQILAVPQSFSADGLSLIYGLRGPTTALDLWTVSLDGSHKTMPRLETTAGEQAGRYSPDGKWLAYQSNEAGPQEVYVQSATGAAGKWPISTGGGAGVRWRGDSKELYYIGAGKMWAVEISSRESVLVRGVPQALFDYRGLSNAAHPSYFTSYDVTKDGQKFLVTRRESDSEPSTTASPLVVVLNWRQGLTK